VPVEQRVLMLPRAARAQHCCQLQPGQSQAVELPQPAQNCQPLEAQPQWPFPQRVQLPQELVAQELAAPGPEQRHAQQPVFPPQRLKRRPGLVA
jgi:hypothetical protein